MQQRNSTPEITKKFISSLKCYEDIEDKEGFDLFVTQNGFSFNINTIDAYIKNNYFELTKVTCSLDGSRLAELPKEIIANINSYLKLEEVKIEELNILGEDAHTPIANIV